MPKNMSLYCGVAVHNAWVSLGQTLQAIHNHTINMWVGVENTRLQAGFFTQIGINLYTFFQQYYTMFVSVSLAVVHIFHSAYKDYCEVKKGVY